jgi:hypothetical protein
MRTIDMEDSNPPTGGGPRRPRFKHETQIKMPPLKNLIWGGAGGVVALSLVVLGLSGNLGVTDIRDDQVAVKINYLTGSREVITSPGYKLYIPFIQEVFPLDQTPQKYLMQGKRVVNENHVPFLTVRARDGSNFWFDSLEIQYALLPGKADLLLDDSGPGDAFKRDWIRAYARSVLRDEFGRFSATEVAKSGSYEVASRSSVERMNEILNPHGIQILNLITPMPRFDPRYENAIDERKVADQDVERLRVFEEQLIQQRAQKLAEVEKEKEIEWQSLQGDLVKAIKESEREAIFVTKGADKYKVTREAEGQAELASDTAIAEGMRAKYTKEAEGILARTKALEERGRVVVREALIEKLSKIHFTLIPYNRDPSPRRLELLGGDEKAGAAGATTEGGL